jgi:hypothetical protein
MRSRFTVATATFVTLLGFVLLGLMTQGNYGGSAKAQRVSIPADQGSVRGNWSSAPAALQDSRTEPPRQVLPAAGYSAGSIPPLEGHPRLGVSSSHPIVVAIKDGPELHGNLVERNALQFQTVFGLVSIPINTILGVRMAEDPRQPATICLWNGDSLTGTLTGGALTMNTAWGSATIAGDHIISVVTTEQPAQWKQNAGRWYIVVREGEELAPPDTEQQCEGQKSDAADRPPSLEMLPGPQTPVDPSEPTEEPEAADDELPRT